MTNNRPNPGVSRQPQNYQNVSQQAITFCVCVNILVIKENEEILKNFTSHMILKAKTIYKKISIRVSMI